ncbi:hypothetical protein AGABI2DRAFT_115001 [Agaricus bisporus var. bisporus H97]|uniref:hypothetical protein n=1 Tax=Agaricus bisporus var. bisporus (strain H97 / ATCC MYA-4626 / FGSC 10389) TaxID=936046 RepID=UPI00029F7F8C|nr:hypothetical protein AGABI2DRAFT_115001 [Agaricus bisporus var. bisporus H97]EKV49935.1 hypothetical protein AGABI2DRAFT_115001 [Agaricus bisporus var. bisporus H97]
MPPLRRKRSPTLNKGLQPGESLNRYLVPNNRSQSSLWAWVGSEVSREADITTEHCLMACGLSSRNNFPFCMSKHSALKPRQKSAAHREHEPGRDDVIIISDDEGNNCTKKDCKDNPNCLNYLGQDKWADEESAMSRFFKVATAGHDPTEDNRESELPVGLENLGATCYANASLQVWFRNLTFRRAVYRCVLSQANDSPLFQLQVTFTALQEGSRKVYNPAFLVESLQLRAAEQQDAQEFSKLFMSHLDAEFKKQPVPELRSLVSKQFQGTQVYGTTCDTCHYRSEKTTDFLELEIRFDSNCTLEDCLAMTLQEEKLTGDDKYHCPQCDELRDATRYTQLSELPPTLHFSLHRFVYDLSTMERRKSKYTISFPTILNMNQFVLEGNHQHEEDNLYELAGILLHKGASAYHGHYEAQVYDIEKRSWFQFNDEVVTRIKSLGDKKKPKDSGITIDEGKPTSSLTKGSLKKRTRIVSEDEMDSSPPKVSLSTNISSRDAYMLIYVRRSERNQTTDTETPAPPEEALSVIHSLNNKHEEDCREYVQKVDLIKEQFMSVRKQIWDICQSWNPTSACDDCVVVSQKLLQNWLAQDCVNLAKSVSSEAKSSSISPPIKPDEDTLVNPDDSLVCKHQMLDPLKAKCFKRVKRDTYHKMMDLTGCRNEPVFSPLEVCRQCVCFEFKERLYIIEHPKLVREFDEISEVDGNASGFWISKRWLKDWRLSRPKMHIIASKDPAPDSPDYKNDVWCEHDALAVNGANRRKISGQAADFLKILFPSWDPISSDAEYCTVCDAFLHTSREGKRESRRRVEEEKELLKSMYDIAPFSENDEMFAIITNEFYEAWLLWVNNPMDQVRPAQLDNSSFLCEHGLLTLDPNCYSDTHMTATFIRQCDWEVLEKLYDSGPYIGLKRAAPNSSDRIYEPGISVCEECRLKRKTEWVTTDIAVRLLRGKDVKTFPECRPVATYSAKNRTRQSKRLRQARDNEKRRFAVTKKTTVKDVKIKIQESFNIPTICQRLFFRGQELENNDVTLEDLQIFANDIMDLREESEVHEIDSDFEERPVKKQRREAERGFEGTVLSGGINESDLGKNLCLNSTDDPSGDLSQVLDEKTCAVCTLLNALDAAACKICDTPFV